MHPNGFTPSGCFCVFTGKPRASLTEVKLSFLLRLNNLAAIILMKNYGVYKGIYR